MAMLNNQMVTILHSYHMFTIAWFLRIAGDDVHQALTAPQNWRGEIVEEEWLTGAFYVGNGWEWRNGMIIDSYYGYLWILMVINGD